MFNVQNMNIKAAENVNVFFIFRCLYPLHCGDESIIITRNVVIA